MTFYLFLTRVTCEEGDTGTKWLPQGIKPHVANDVKLTESHPSVHLSFAIHNS